MPKLSRYAALVLALLLALSLAGCVSEFPGLWWLFGDAPADAPAVAPAEAPAGPGPAPAQDAAAPAEQSVPRPGPRVSCHYGERLQCWGEFSNPDGLQVDYYWAVNGEAVNAGQTNGASVAHTHEPSAAGDYAVEFAVRYPDGTRVSATTVETIASLGSGGGDGGATDDCPGGVYILGVCADE